MKTLRGASYIRCMYDELLERGEAGFYFYQFRVLSSQLSLSCGIKYITSLKRHVIYMLSLVKINEICP